MSEQQPLVSVVVPVFNRAHVIKQTLDTVGEQTYRPIQLIVVDDCSDDSEALQNCIADFRAQFTDIDVEYQRHEVNQHGAAARNTGIRVASGAFIALLDSDDLWTTNKLDVAIRYLQSHPNSPGIYSSFTRMIAGGQRVEPERGIHHDESVADYLLYSNQSMQTSSLVLRRTVTDVVLFDPALKRFQDYDYCIALDRAGYRLDFLEQNLVIMTDNDSGNRISNSINLAPVHHWRNKIKAIVSKRAYAAFSINRLARYLLLNGNKMAAARLLFNPRLAWACPKKIYIQLVMLWLIPTALYASIKKSIAAIRERRSPNG